MFTVYKTTNQINQKFYIGVHKTKNPNDDYLGSGKILLRAIQKYGIENFTKEVLFCFESSEEAFKKEMELVDAVLNTPHCYNIKRGGAGGYDYINLNNLHNTGPADKVWEQLLADPEYKKKWMEKILPARLNSDSWKNAMKNQNWLTFEGKNHSDETKKKMSLAKKDSYLGESNPAFGTCWITKDGVTKKIFKVETEFWTQQGWLPGRNLKSKPS